jgi:hypothetical protein
MLPGMGQGVLCLPTDSCEGLSRVHPVAVSSTEVGDEQPDAVQLGQPFVFQRAAAALPRPSLAARGPDYSSPFARALAGALVAPAFLFGVGCNICSKPKSCCCQELGRDLYIRRAQCSTSGSTRFWWLLEIGKGPD